MGVGEGQERKEGRFSPFALSLFASSPPPPPKKCLTLRLEFAYKQGRDQGNKEPGRDDGCDTVEDAQKLHDTLCELCEGHLVI